MMTWGDFDVWLKEHNLHKGKYLYVSSFGGKVILDCVMNDKDEIVDKSIDFQEDGDSGEIEEAIERIKNFLSK